MPPRKGIYQRQFSANVSATPTPSDATISWSYSLVNPQARAESKLINNTSAPQEEISEKYMVHHWVSTTIPDSDTSAREKLNQKFVDCEDDDKDAVIDLDMYTYIPTQKDQDSMSMSDIKSAFGGGTAGNALFSSSAAHAIEKDKQDAKEAEEAKQSLKEANVSSNPDDAVKDSEGDVPMN